MELNVIGPPELIFYHVIIISSSFVAIPSFTPFVIMEQQPSGAAVPVHRPLPPLHPQNSYTTSIISTASIQPPDSTNQSTPTDPNHLRYRKSVRCIAITDICIAFFMLSYFSLRLLLSHSGPSDGVYHQHGTSVSGTGNTYHLSSTEIPNFVIIIWVCIFSVYALQLGMGQLLLSATYNGNTEVVISRCQKWHWSSQFLNIILGIELLILLFRIQGSHIALGISIVKIIFRLVANHMVRVFIWDLRRAQLAPFHARVLAHHHPHSHSHLLHGGSHGHGHQHFGGEFPSIHLGNLEPPPPAPPPPISTSINIPNYEPPPTYEEAIREKNFPQDYNNVA